MKGLITQLPQVRLQKVIDFSDIENPVEPVSFHRAIGILSETLWWIRAEIGTIQGEISKKNDDEQERLLIPRNHYWFFETTKK